MQFPNPPSGSSIFASFLRRLLAACRADRLLPGLGYRITRTPAGTLLTLDESPGGGLGISAYRFKVHHGNYIEARSWNGTTEGSSLVKIAKPHELMSGLTSQIIDGVTFDYSAYDDNDQTRHAVGTDGTTEDQVIVPRYCVDSLIWAAAAKSFIATDGTFQVNGGTKAEISLIDLNRAGRVYAQI